MKIRTLLTRSILAAAVVTSFGLGAQAFAESPQGDAAEMARLEKAQKRLDRRMERMTKRLKLTPAQATKVRSILETRRASVQDAIARAGGDRQAAKPEIKSIRKSSRKALKATLTADQIATMKTMRGKHKGHKRAGKRKMMKSLNLSEAQRAQFKAIRKESRTQRQAILAQADGDRQAAKPALKALRFETKEKISKILTPAQRAKFQKFEQERRAQRKARKAARQAK